MLTFDEAKKIGLQACINKLGPSFVKSYIDTSTTAYGDYDRTHVFCFVGVDTNPQPSFDGKYILSSKKKDAFQYRVSCTVSKKSGNVTFLECVLPKHIIV